MPENNAINSKQDLSTTSSPTLSDLTLSSLTPSLTIGTDSNKKLISLPDSGIFMQTADGPIVTATTVETSILGTGDGSLTVPANAFAVSGYQMDIGANFGALNNDTVLIRVKSGAITLSTHTVNLESATNQVAEILLDFTIRQIGAATTAEILTACKFTYNRNTGNEFVGQHGLTLNNTTFDTTISNTLSITAQFSSASASNTIQTRSGTLYRRY